MRDQFLAGAAGAEQHDRDVGGRDALQRAGDQRHFGRGGDEATEACAGGAGGEDASGAEFYLRYYVGHKGKFGHEFLEFEFRPDGKLRYANNSNYKNDTMIRKEVFVSPSVLREARRVIQDSEVCIPLANYQQEGI
jgi:hypothetical protein